MNDKSQFWEDLKSGRFVSMVKESAKGQRLSNSQEVYNVLKPIMAEEDDIEKVYIIFLDAQNKILSIEKMFSGSISAASIYPREIVKKLINLKASAFLIAHNLCKALHKLCYVNNQIMLSKVLSASIILSNSCPSQFSTSHNSKP
jgi:DNA repair protein RadC